MGIRRWPEGRTWLSVVAVAVAVGVFAASFVVIFTARLIKALRRVI